MNHHTRSASRWACRKSLTAVLFCLNIVAHTAVLRAQGLSAFSHVELVEQMNAEFVQARKNFEAKISNTRGLYKLDGTINEQNPAYKDYDKQLKSIAKKYNANDMRYDDFVDICKKAGVGQNLVNSGSKPTSRYSDLDFSELKPGEAQKVVDYMKKNGIQVKGLPDRFVVPGTDNTIWINQPKTQPGTDAHRAQCRKFAAAEDVFSTAGGVEVTTKGKLGVKDPVGYPIANAKKFNDAVQMGDKTLRPDLPEAVQKIDSRTAGKSVSKVIEGGFVNTDPAFAKQAKLLRSLPPATAWESAGIVRFTDTPQVKADKIRQWLAKGEGYLGKAVVSSQVQSVKVATKRGEIVKLLLNSGLRKTAADVIRRQVHANISNQETILSVGRKNPKLAGEMCGIKLDANRNGTFTNKVTGKNMTPSEVQQAIKNATQKINLESITKATVRGQTKSPMSTKSPLSIKSPTSAIAAVSRIASVGNRFMILEGIFHGAMQGAEKAVDEEQSGDLTNVKATIYGIGYATGIPGLVDMARDAGSESARQFDEELKAGKNPSESWALARAAFSPTVSVVKGMTLDPVINTGKAVWEGVGAATETLSAAWAESQSKKSLQDVRDSKEERARQTEGAEARMQRLILAENVFRTRGIPVVYGSKVPNPAQENDRLKRDNPDEYNHRLAVILTEFDRLAVQLQYDGVLNSEKNRARDEIFKLVQQKYTKTPQEFQKALKHQYTNYKTDYDKLYPPVPTPKELAGKWNGGRITVRSANFTAKSGCTPEMQAQLDGLRGRAMPLDLDVQTDANGNGSLSLGFGPGASALTGQEGPQRVPFQFKDGKIQGQVSQSGGRVFKVNGELVRTDSGWELKGSWQMSAAIEGSTVMLMKGDLSASK